MKAFPIPVPPEGVLPKRPSVLQKIDVASTYDEEFVNRILSGKTLVVAGASLIGKEGYIVATIGILRQTTARPEGGYNIKGWSAQLGHPDERFRQFCHFDTEKGTDVPLPVPNYMVYFACETDHVLVEDDATAETLTEIAHFVAPFISDMGPPEGIDW